jgi:isocitrate dehydrogenase
MSSPQPNLNGDNLSDALAAPRSEAWVWPRVNMSFRSGVLLEPTHDPRHGPDHRGKDLANPGSLILSGRAHARITIGLGTRLQAESARAVELATPRPRDVDLASQMTDAHQGGCAEFGQILLANLERV